ncbi:MAG TPA: 3-hydroxyacyl-CoA dehydrogenase NAD-binding domain-containing protein [Candidatus Krumholzibacteria bacterium]|nr:3-hydroxyacyl-CoA dehydrogenase NAD-binding domain-containing protein [Candidatus Krumholzibacteria bacterium]
MGIDRIAVIGAGIMGRGIAQVAAVGGFETVLQDIDAGQLQSGLRDVQASLAKAVDRGSIEAEQARLALTRLRTVVALDAAVAGAQLVIEAVPERIHLKLEILEKLDRLCSPQTILASNTSSLSITEMAAVTQRAPLVLGMHFFNPVPRMRLLEIVRALETSASAIEAAQDIARRMGKEPVVVRESPGFITSRINALIGNEAFRMLEEGVASAADIDKALKLGLNHPMGPFELVDLVGLDTRLSILEYLHRALGERFRPSPLLVQYVKGGRLGRKTGRGVYEYGSST